jgi:hypothetical protein
MFSLAPLRVALILTESAIHQSTCNITGTNMSKYRVWRGEVNTAYVPGVCALQVSLYGLVKIQSFYLPFAFACISLLMGQSIIPDLLGIVVGHIYWYLKVCPLDRSPDVALLIASLLCNLGALICCILHLLHSHTTRPVCLCSSCPSMRTLPCDVHAAVTQDIYPRQSGNNVLTTPGFLRQWCADAGLRGSAPPPREAAGQPQGFQAFRGSGRRLGGQ